MNLLHVVYDEKFVMFAADVFGAVEGVANRFLVFVDDVAAPLRHVRPGDGFRVVDRRAYFRSPDPARDLACCDALIVHYLDTDGARLILRADANTPVVWSGWGGDYHDLLPDHDAALFGPETRGLVAGAGAPRGSGAGGVSASLGRAVRTWRRRAIERLWLRRAMARVDFFSAPIPEDFAVYSRVVGVQASAEYVQLNYASVERTFARGPSRITGNDILVGNSASATNNHADVFALLAGLDLGDRRIVVPLSYGDAWYRDAVIRRGRALFADRLVPLVEYMPLDEYNAILAGCSVALMGHRRQQGLGNVAALLWLGARVYLDDATPLLPSLRARGATVGTFTELRAAGGAGLAPLPSVEQRRNARMVMDSWAHEVVVRNAAALVERLSARTRRSCA